MQDLRFWGDLRRRRLPPFYIIPGIHTTPLVSLNADLEAVYHPARLPVPQDSPAAPAAAAPVGAAPPPRPPMMPPTTAAPLALLPSVPPPSQPPVPIDEVPQDRLYPSAAEVLVLEEDFKCVLEILRQPQGVHPKLFERISPFIGQMHAFAHDVREAKHRRTQERTYDDATPNTMFLD
ncbi:hypothetical protein AURDEDRAFT_176372 [Auricularia subglabra TFB-10046 SS5]|uniref:Uncharacterized protein n=1 Tax=Auricularia subglabra (strain TFB-10046 / SS5) TaxID=717982 RepID=J0WQ55_AURST|nr:hypothetical protein AURDEDRAFT_176372 [Auricularia subglabra TFB-10046 SS5]